MQYVTVVEYTAHQVDLAICSATRAPFHAVRHLVHGPGQPLVQLDVSNGLLFSYRKALVLG